MISDTSVEYNASRILLGVSLDSLDHEVLSIVYYLITSICQHRKHYQNRKFWFILLFIRHGCLLLDYSYC
jgi:hypothetical protein